MRACVRACEQRTKPSKRAFARRKGTVDNSAGREEARDECLVELGRTTDLSWIADRAVEALHVIVLQGRGERRVVRAEQRCEDPDHRKAGRRVTSLTVRGTPCSGPQLSPLAVAASAAAARALARSSSSTTTAFTRSSLRTRESRTESACVAVTCRRLISAASSTPLAHATVSSTEVVADAIAQARVRLGQRCTRDHAARSATGTGVPRGNCVDTKTRNS